MGLLRRESIFLTGAVILALTACEGWVAWRYVRASSGSQAARVAALEAELASKQGELNRLIILRDTENRRAAAASARVALAPVGTPADPEAELAQANADLLAAPQGAAPRQNIAAARTARGNSDLGPSDIDPAHLVNMANIMSGRPIAELTRTGGHAVIRYLDTSPADDDPLWHLIDAVTQSRALTQISIVGRKNPEELRKITQLMTENGVPAQMIRAEQTGVQGIHITLANRPEKRSAR